MPLTIADMAMRLETPRIIPSMVRSERNLCAQISLKPSEMALSRSMELCCQGRLAMQTSKPWIDFFGNLAVANLDPAGSDGGNFRIVRHQNDSAPFLT